MSLIIPAKKLAVDIFSAVDQQLDWLVKTSPKANPDEIVNALAKKAKHTEINGATDNMKVFSESKITNAVELQNHYKMNGRPDGWDITEIKGTPYELEAGQSAPIRLNVDDQSNWQTFLDEANMDIDTPFNETNLDSVVNSFEAYRDGAEYSVTREQFEDLIEQTGELKTRLDMQKVTAFTDRDGVKFFDILNDHDLYPLNDEFSLGDADDAIVALEEMIGAAEDAGEAAFYQRDIRAIKELKEKYELSRGTEVTTETMDLTRTTQEFVDNAGEEFDRIAREAGIDSPDANDPHAVASFFNEARNAGSIDQEHLGQLEQSYGNLRMRIEAGDETITIPDYNTRQVQSNVRYDFEPHAFREATMPDTDDATYAIRGYDDKTIDRKGFDRNVHYWGGIFFTRTDSPVSYAHRIQELQSDVMNQMATARAAAIGQWKRNPTAADMPFGVVTHKKRGANEYGEITSRSMYEPNDPEIVKLRGQVNDKVAVEFEDEVGGGIELASNYSINDIREEMVGLLHPQSTVNPQKTVDSYSQDVIDFLDELEAGNNQYAEATTEIVEELSDRTGLRMSQVRDVIDQTKNLEDTYKKHLVRQRGLMVMDAADAAKYRVTPEARKIRITLGRGISKEEGELNSNAVVDTLSEISEKYGIDAQPYKGAKRSDDFNDIIHESIMSSDNTTLEKMDGTFREEIVAEANKIFNKKIDDGMKELKPLEKFPDAKKFQLDYNWQKQGLQEEIVYAIKNGLTEVWLTGNPEGVGYIGRGVNPQKQYVKGIINPETGKKEGGMIYDKFKSLAKKFHAELVEEDGYLKMKLPTGKKLLAATGGTGVLPIAAVADTDREDMHEELIQAGYSPAEAKTLLDESWDADPDDAAARQDLINADYSQEEIDFLFNEAFVNELTEDQFAEHPGMPIESDVPLMEGQTPALHKIPYEQVKEIAIELEVDPTTPMGMDAIYQEMEYKQKPELRRRAEEEAADIYMSDVRRDMGVITEHNDVWQPYNYMLGGLGDATKQALYEKKKAEIESRIIESGKKYGYDLRLGKGDKLNGHPMSEDIWYAVINNKPYEATPEWWRTFLHEEGEIIGAIAGAHVGKVYADQITAAMGPYGMRFKWANQAAGIMIGGVVGGMAGDQGDYISNLMRAHEKYNWSVAKDKAIGSAQLTVMGDVAGTTVIRFGASSWGIATRAYHRVAEGNLNGAYEMLKKITDLSDTQIVEIVEGWEKLAGKDAPVLEPHFPKLQRFWNLFSDRNVTQLERQQALAIIPQTSRGGERIIAGTGVKDPGAGAAITSEVSARADSLGDAARANLGRDGRRGASDSILQSIKDTQVDIEFNYTMQKQRGFELAPEHYGFELKQDYINLLYDDSIESLDLLPIARKLEWVEEQSSSRTFADFLKVRDIAEELYNNPKNTVAMREKINIVREAMDSEIESASQRMGPEGEQWLKDYKGANAEYKEMQQLNKSGLVKYLSKKPGDDFYSKALSDTNLARTLIKYGDSLDGSYNTLIKALPLEAQPKVEALVIDELVQKFTVGAEGQFHAIKFPELAAEMNKLDFIWHEANGIKDIVNQFAEVYRNDVRLSAAAQGGLTEDAFTSYLTTNPIVRLQFSLASRIFNKASQLAGTSRGDASALVNLTTRLLKDPLSPRNVADALEAVKGDAALTSAINRLSAQAAADKHAGKPGTPMHAIFKDSQGRYSLDPGNGREIAEEIPEHRITNEDTANKIIRDSKLDALSKMDRARLISRGFLAVGLKDGSVIKLN